MSTNQEASVHAEDVTAPIVVNLGKLKKKTIKALKKGHGPGMDEVDLCIEQVREELSEDLDGKVLVPVVVLYGEKRKKIQVLAHLTAQPNHLTPAMRCDMRTTSSINLTRNPGCLFS